MQDKLTPRQSRAWGLCALSVPAAMVLAGRGWLWVLAGSAAAGGIVLFLQTLQRRSGQSLLEQMARTFGRRSGRLLGAAVCLWLLLAASGAAAASEIAFEDDLGPLAPSVPLLLAALASRKGQAAAARVSGVLALCLTLLYSIIALASLRHVQAAWCRPWGSAADAGLSLCLCLTPACLLFLDGDGQTPRPGWSALAAAVLPGVAALLCSACLSPAWTAQLPQPLYTLTKSLSVHGAAARAGVAADAARVRGRPHGRGLPRRRMGREEGRSLLSARLRRQLPDAAAADGGMGRRSGYILGCDPDINTSYRKYKKE